jgi:hypothetical protein
MPLIKMELCSQFIIGRLVSFCAEIEFLDSIRILIAASFLFLLYWLLLFI